MSLLSGVSDFFGLDIGTTAIRIVQLHNSGASKSLVSYAQMAIDPKLSMSDSKVEQQALAQALRDLLGQTRLTTKNVAVGIPSHRVFSAVFDVERLSTKELEKTIQLQADSMIPTALDDTKLDWALLGDSPQDKNKLEILLSSVPNEYVEKRLDLLEAIGLNVIAFEPDNLAITRSLLSPETVMPQLIIDMGARTTDIAVGMNGAPRLMRSIPTGSEALIKAAMQNLNIDANQAEQFVYKFGLSKDKLEGQVYQAIIGTVDLLVAEVEKSIKFFSARYTNTKLDRIIVSGNAASLAEFPLYLANKFAVGVELGSAWRNVTFPADKQNELMALSSHFGVAIGLAERNE